jgi:isorenieratene synthase
LSENQLFPVVIIGGGIAGLTAAAHLAAKGVPPLVLDADALWAGGRLAGGDPDIIEHHGQTWSFMPEHGVHAVWGGYENLRATLARFTDTTLNLSPGEEWINRWGREVRRIEAGNAVRSRWIPAPLHYLQLLFHPHIWANITPLDFLSLPGLLVSILLTVGIDPLKEKRALDGLPMREYFRGWTPNLRATFTGLGANLLAAHPDDIDLSAFIAALRFYTMLRRDAWQMSYFPDNPQRSVLQPLIDSFTANDGAIWQGITATKLEKSGDVWRISVEDSAQKNIKSLYAQHIILATNAPGAQRLLSAGADTAPEAQKMIFPAGLRCAVVRLWFTAAPRSGTPGGMLTGDFEPDNFFWLHRLYPEFVAWHEATGGSAIELHLYGSDKLLDQPDNNLLILCVAEVQRAFPELRGAFLHGTVRRNSKVHTRFRVPTDDSLHVHTPWHNVHACGDWIGYDTPSFWMERAATTAVAAANAVLTAQGLDPYPVLQPKPPEISVQILGSILKNARRVLGAPLRLLRR